MGRAIYIINRVDEANISRPALVEAIAAMEAQRAATGNERNLNRAIDIALRALREALAQTAAEPGDHKRRQLTVLVADLSGFTTFSERMDAERLRDAINAMWRELDAVIRAWGGEIDQHAGDSLMALFGLVHPRQGDAARALHAALAMQQELALFNERVRGAADDSREGAWAADWPGPRMRIGIHLSLIHICWRLAVSNCRPHSRSRSASSSSWLCSASMAAWRCSVSVSRWARAARASASRAASVRRRVSRANTSSPAAAPTSTSPCLLYTSRCV